MTEEIGSTYAGPGRKCRGCSCWFCSEVDFKLHQKVCQDRKDELMGWRQGSNGEWICSVDKDLELAKAIRRNGGKVLLGHFEVKLSKNEKWLVRRMVQFQ